VGGGGARSGRRTASAVRLEAYPYLDYLTYLGPASSASRSSWARWCREVFRFSRTACTGTTRGISSPDLDRRARDRQRPRGTIVASLAGLLVLAAVLLVIAAFPSRTAGRSSAGVVTVFLTALAISAIGSCSSRAREASRSCAGCSASSTRCSSSFGRALSGRVVSEVAAGDLSRGSADLRRQRPAGPSPAREHALRVFPDWSFS
jgi:hypothetical protein